MALSTSRLREFNRLTSRIPLILTTLVLVGGTGPVVIAGTDSVDVYRPIAVTVDIRPGLCPNHLRLESYLTIPIAVLGSLDFDAANIDPETIRLSRDGAEESVAPVGWVREDVGTPLVGGLCACHKLRGDGVDDLNLSFSIDEVATTLGLDDNIGETVPLILSGNLITGEAIAGVDCAVMISGMWDNDELGDEIGMLTCPEEGAGTEQFEFAYYTSVSDRVTFAIYDLRGRVVAKLADMDMAPGIYRATWNGTGIGLQKVPAGIYFARVSNSWASETRKIAVLQ
ncbi:MAG: T9SS type A sorting domain-containing protein [Candidatus Eisenbacteria bacterium]